MLTLVDSLTPDGDRSTRQAENIRCLNDAFRQRLPRTDAEHRVVVTAGLSDLTIEQFVDLIEAVRRFDALTPENDPHCEHDFGAIDFAGQRYFWKIDAYDRELEYASPDPDDPVVTIRVLTLMLASEY